MPYYELGKSINRKGCIRTKRDAKTKKELQEFVKNNRHESTYFSVYQFMVISNGTPVYDTAVCDKLFLEMDGEDHGILNNKTWHQLRKFIDWVREESTPIRTLNPIIYFSGNSGYHVLFNLSKIHNDLRNDKIIKHLLMKIKDNSGVDLDDNAMKGFSQMRRIPNTLNHKSNYYCIPLTIDEAYEYGPDRILELAKKPRNNVKQDTTPSTYFNDIIPMIKKKIEDPDTEKHPFHAGQNKDNYKRVSRYMEGNRLGFIRPCLFQLINKDNPGFDERTWLACELMRVGAIGVNDKGHYMTGHAHEIFKHFKRYSYETSEFHFRKLIDKKLYAPSCKYLHEKGLCNEFTHSWYWNRDEHGVAPTELKDKRDGFNTKKFDGSLKKK